MRSPGLPIYADIYEENVSEPRALPKVLERLKTGDLGQLTIVMGRSIATKDNVALIKGHRLNYIVITRADKAGAYRDEFALDEGFTEIEDAIGKDKGERIKKLMDGESAVVLARSIGRAAKVSTIDAQVRSRFYEELTRLGDSISRGGVKRTQVVSERIGRIREDRSYPRG